MKRFLIGSFALALFLYIVALTSCTALSRHTSEPYDRDPEAAGQIERAAADWCAERGYPGSKPTLPFRFDACSWWIDRFGDADWRHCCQEHDYAYWCGGSAEDRERADDQLASCVASETNLVYGWLMRSGVRVGGHPAVPLYFRWGFGHEYAGCYPEAAASSQSAP